MSNLDLSNNLLQKFPEVFECINLQTLILGHNVIKEIPDEINELQQLTTLEISHNYLEEFNPNLVIYLFNHHEFINQDRMNHSYQN